MGKVTDFRAGQDFISTLRGRRSIYHLGKAGVEDEEITAYLKEIFSSLPSAYNAKTQRIILLLGKENVLFWKELVPGVLKKYPEKENAAKLLGLCESFSKGNGTILFFSDSKVAGDLKSTFTEYAPLIDMFAAQDIGISEYAMWLGLSKIGMGANLQHFLGLDAVVRTAYNVDPNWILNAQMPFGSIEKEPAAKDRTQLPEYFRTIK